MNDNRPKFLLAEYQANIHANYSVGQTFLKVTVFDLVDYTAFSRVIGNLLSTRLAPPFSLTRQKKPHLYNFKLAKFQVSTQVNF